MRNKVTHNRIQGGRRAAAFLLSVGMALMPFNTMTIGPFCTYADEAAETTETLAVQTEEEMDSWNVSVVQEDYYHNQASVQVDYTLPEQLGENYDVYYGISEDMTSEPLTWQLVPEDKTITIQDSTAGEFSRYIYFRYGDGVNYGEATSATEIRFDNGAPSVETIAVEDVVTLGSVNWTKESATIKITAKDSGSGLAECMYAFVDSPVLTAPDNMEKAVEADGVYSIVYSANDKHAYLYFQIEDKAGNIYADSYSLEDIQFDFTKPNDLTDSSLRYYTTYTEENAEANVEVENLAEWQKDNVVIAVAPTDGDPSNSTEGVSGIADVTIVDDYNGNEQKLTAVDALGNYTYVVSGDGVHNIKLTVNDNVGNSISTDTITVKVDVDGIQNPQLMLTPTANAYHDTFEVQAYATSVSGIKSITLYYKIGDEIISGTGVVYTSQITQEGNVYRVTSQAPKEVLDQKRDIYISVVFEDKLGRHVTVNSGKFSFNTQGSKITFTNQDSGWKNQDIIVPITVEDSVSGIQEVGISVNGETVTPTLVSTSETKRSYLLVISSNSPSAGTRVSVSVTNCAEDVTVGEFIYRLDKQAPDISLSGAAEGAVYNSNRSLSITTTENIWQAMNPVHVTATRTIDGETTNLDLGEYNVSGEVTTVVRTFTEDGIYTVTADAVDAAGNSNRKSITFTIDKTAPELTISGIREGAYSGTPVTLNFQAVESFYETNRVSIQVERRLEGSAYASTVNFTNSGKVSSASNTFSADGDYIVTMTAVDAAGNEAQTQTLTFTVDVTAPVVSIDGVVDYFITSNPIALEFSVVESYYDSNQVRITGTRRTIDGKEEAINITGWVNAGKISSLKQKFTEDGYYTITLLSTDKAGNKREKTIHFTIDTQPPVIADLSKYNGRYYTSFQLEEKLEDLILELTAPAVRMTLNGKAYDGSEVTEDGKYTLVIEVMDEVGFTSSQTIEFAIDNTAPKIIFAGAADGKTYTEAVRLNLSLENENDNIEQIMINGEEQLLTEGKTSYDYTFNTFDTYTVSVDTVDEAGNTNSQSITFTYAEHKQTGYLWVILAAAAAAVVLAAVLVIGGRRRK
jgi:hypothetical protein